MRFLNSKERKAFFGELAELYGYEGSTNFVVYEGGQEKFYVISRDVEKVPFEELRIRQGGLYVAARASDGLRLTLDGAMLFGKDCTKIVDIDDKQKDSWMMGNNIIYLGDQLGWVIIRWNTDILGCGKVKEKIILNYVPKGRRISDPH